MDLSQFKPSQLILFFFQILLIFIVVIASLINLSIECGNKDLWIILLTSVIGYLMPNPKIKLNNGHE